MELREITPDYLVSPQLSPEDMKPLAEAGVARVICNRPDAEIPPSHQADAMEAAAIAAGLEFVRIPLTHQTMTPENIARQKAAMEGASGRVLAYCASGTRSTVAWAIGQIGTLSVDQIIGTARAGGYDLEGLRPALMAAEQAGLG